MRILTIMAAGWPAFTFQPATETAPADYLEQERCLAVLNIAAAVPTREESPGALVLKQRKLVGESYDRLEMALVMRAGLTPEQVESGMAVFEHEQQQWLEAFGDAMDYEARHLVVKHLMEEVTACLPLIPN